MDDAFQDQPSNDILGYPREYHHEFIMEDILVARHSYQQLQLMELVLLQFIDEQLILKFLFTI